MIDLELDPITNDLVIENFDFQLIDGVDQITQNTGIRLRFFLGEWFIDITQGIPYYQEIFKKSPNQIQVDNIIKNEIITTFGIEEILSYTSDYNQRTRLFTVNFRARTFSEENILLELELPA